MPKKAESNPSLFRRRLSNRERLIGTFVKTPTAHAIEILGSVGYDFVIVDEEHAPFDRGGIDNALLAACAAGTAGFVRVATQMASNLQSVLDSGAVGVLVPHVSSAAKARDVAAACRYRGGSRGFSNAPRAGGYGARSMWDHVKASDEGTTVIATIEDPQALDEIDQIAATPGIDALFVGRADLAVALDASGVEAPAVREAVERIAVAARKAAKPLCAMVGRAEEGAWLGELGTTVFIVSSDQGFLRQAAAQALAEFSQASTLNPSNLTSEKHGNAR